MVDTVAWHPQNVMMPGASENELLVKYIEAIHERTTHLQPVDTQSLTELHRGGRTLGSMQSCTRLDRKPILKKVSTILLAFFLLEEILKQLLDY